MDSEKIKIIVAKVNGLLRGQEEAGKVMEAITKDMGRSPTFAVAIIQHVKENGVDLMSLSGETAEAFRAKFKPQMEKLGERELTQIKRILSKLFSA